MRAPCARADCDAPAKARGLCKKHYDRERGPRHRHREDRVLNTRARNRALAELARRHSDEFAEILAVTREQAQAEAAELRKVADAIGAEVTGDGRVLRLKAGPASDDEDTIDRVVLTAPACARCDEYHSSGHRCLHCGALPSRAITDSNRFNPILVPAELSDERIAAAVRRGERRRADEADDVPDDADDDAAEMVP